MSIAIEKSSRAITLVTTIASALLCLSACATIMHGTHESVGISSSPTGATVMIDNEGRGQTPMIAKMSRGADHIIRIEMPGYQPFEATVTHGVSGWVWGNLVFGGLVGLAVDAISGGLYKLDPEQVSGTLAQSRANVVNPTDGVYVAVVLKPQSGWIKIGQLQR